MHLCQWHAFCQCQLLRPRIYSPYDRYIDRLLRELYSNCWRCFCSIHWRSRYGYTLETHFPLLNAILQGLFTLLSIILKAEHGFPSLGRRVRQQTCLSCRLLLPYRKTRPRGERECNRSFFLLILCTGVCSSVNGERIAGTHLSQIW